MTDSLTGYCQSYVKKGESCNPTGHNTCGCQRGTKCTRIDDGKDTPFPVRLIFS